MFSDQEHRELKECINLIGAPIWVVEMGQDKKISLVSCNTPSLEIVDLSIADLIARPLEAIMAPYLYAQLSESILNAMAENERKQTEINVNHLGENRWWQCIFVPINSSDTDPQRVIITFIEITQSKDLTKALDKVNSRFKAIVDSANDGIISVDKNETILLANNAAQQIFQNKNLVGQQIETLLPKKYRAKHSEYMSSFNQSEVPSRPMHMRADVMGQCADGSEVPLEISIARINVGGDTEMTAVLRDTTEKNKLMRELSHISRVDKLTELYNRRYTEPLIYNEYDRAKRYQNPLSLLFIDIDHFKQFNDDYGHSVGDNVLQAVASVILKNTRELDTACRWGGEEMLVIAPETVLDDAVMLAEKLRAAIEAMVVKNKHRELSVTVSIGIATINEQHSTANEFIEAADKNMYTAKRNGRNCCFAG